MDEWNSFFLASAGASAALTGLIFVGVSLSLSEILKTKTLPSRAAISLMLLSTILFNSLLYLIPVLSTAVHGYAIFFCSLFMWLLITRQDIIIIKNIAREFRTAQLGNAGFDQTSLALMILSGLMLILNGSAGIYWIVPGFILAFAKSISDAWVLLVEINR